MALSIDVLEVATAVHAVAEAVRAVHSRLSIDDMLELTQQAAVGRTGAAGLAFFASVQEVHDVSSMKVCLAGCSSKVSSLSMAKEARNEPCSLWPSFATLKNESAPLMKRPSSSLRSVSASTSTC